jgi:hypothetical protein
VTELGGDPACWLDQVCEICGAVVDDPEGHCPPEPETPAEPAE